METIAQIFPLIEPYEYQIRNERIITHRDLPPSSVDRVYRIRDMPVVAQLMII